MKPLTICLLLLVPGSMSTASETGSPLAGNTNQLAKADSTNSLFIFEGAEIYLENAKGRWINPAVIAQSQTNSECWSASDFPEGNWGQIVDGFQISLRLDKLAYTNQEPIRTVVLVRNTTNRVIQVQSSNPVTYGMINYWAYTKANQLVPQKIKDPYHVCEDFRPRFIRPNMQRKFEDTLNYTYDLTKGQYWVEAAITLYRPSTNDTFIPYEVKSAKVPVEIK